jgi:hypothetical protein
MPWNAAYQIIWKFPIAILVTCIILAYFKILRKTWCYRFPPWAPLAPCGLGEHHANSHSSEQDTQPIIFIISKQAAPYWTCGGTCCPGVSTPKIWSIADSSTTCHDGVNHLHHSIHCSNHNIDPHTAKSHLHGWKTTSLTLRHKPNWTSQRMEDLHDTQDYMAKQN